jgi:REP element-mobilizing transposase RayT
LIFSTKNREPVIVDEIRDRLHAYLGGIANECKAVPIAINGIDDHVHLLVQSPAALGLPDFMRTLKANSSKWVHVTFATSHAFAWQNGYAAFSVSKSNVPAVKEYIARQQEHHRRIGFQEELLEFLKRHDVNYDPAYIWS